MYSASPIAYTTSSVRCYARRMIIENVISDTIDFFHMDALSVTVPMKIHVDLQLTLIAGLLYRLLGIRVGERKELAETRTLFRELIPKRAKIHLTEKEIIVQYPRRTHNPLLMNAEHQKVNLPIPRQKDGRNSPTLQSCLNRQKTRFSYGYHLITKPPRPSQNAQS